MKKYLVINFLAMCSFVHMVKAQEDYKMIHKDIIVVDGHNDVIISSILDGHDISNRLTTGHTDIPRLIEGGVDVQVFAVWSDDKKWKTNAFKHANDQIDALEKVIKKNKGKIAIAKSVDEIYKLQKKGKIAAVIGIEGGNMIEESIPYLVKLHKRGAKYLTLTWNYNLSWATAASLEDGKPTNEQRGLSEKGREIIRKMNELGMMVDLSHVSKKTFYDVLEVSTKPILVSHSNAAALTPHSRNLDDAQLAALKENKGVVGVNFYSGFLDTAFESRIHQLYDNHFGKPTEKMSASRKYHKLPKELKFQADAKLDLLLDHIDYLVSKVGIDHVAIGSDYDGIESTPQYLEDVSKLPILTKSLLERGYQKDDTAKIMGLNFLRIMKENEE
ncbi:dipeptidase [Sphingobacterium composti Ten et al. 2007 non Yoo et al. 2007]|uniref:dipeptidase n=1 Tax=Sphingobacterium composti TaxID=363260 RepID=UPI00135769D6|nr:dipeptidase [Sphingobacterium composti Ten et al. 2007 non Yoo et al. 2007]